MKICQVLILFSLIFLMAGSVSLSENIQSLLDEIYQVSSPTGYEEKMAARIIKLLPEKTAFIKDNLGSLYVHWGNEKPFSVFITGMDEYGYFVSNITSEGYLNLDRAVRAPHLLFDSMFFGHPMLIHSEKGAVKGVIALPSLHILSSEKRRELEKLFVLDNAYLDIGARSRQDVAERGIKLLDPVTPVSNITELPGGKISGYALGRKICTALLLDLMQEASKQNFSRRSSVVWLAQSLFPVRGTRPPASLGALRAVKILTASQLIFLDIYPCDREPDDKVRIGKGPVLFLGLDGKTDLAQNLEKYAAQMSLDLQTSVEAPSMLLFSGVKGDKEHVCLCLPVKAAYTPSETVSLQDVKDMQKMLVGLWKREAQR